MDRRSFLKSGIALASVNIPFTKLVELGISGISSQSSVNELANFLKDMKMIRPKIKEIEVDTHYVFWKVQKFWSNGQITTQEVHLSPGNKTDYDQQICDLDDDCFKRHEDELNSTEAYQVNISTEIEEHRSKCLKLDESDPLIKLVHLRFGELVNLMENLDENNKDDLILVAMACRYIMKHLDFTTIVKCKSWKRFYSKWGESIYESSDYVFDQADKLIYQLIDH